MIALVVDVACNSPHTPMTTPATEPAAIAHSQYSDSRYCCYRMIAAPDHCFDVLVAIFCSSC